MISDAYIPFTVHAANRCAERGIERREVFEAIELGQASWNQRHALVFRHRKLTAVVSADTHEIITAYRDTPQ